MTAATPFSQQLTVAGHTYAYVPITTDARAHSLPFSMKILLENLLRHQDERTVRAGDIEALLNWDPQAEPTQEIAFRPARVLLQDFTGVPAVVDLAAMRDAMVELGGDPARINPVQPADLVIDHSVQVDAFGSAEALRINADLEYARNQERYRFLKWGQQAFDTFKVVPPDTGIVHQVNLEFLAHTVFVEKTPAGPSLAYPDSLVGTDSHTTMINGLGVLGWGVGGIEAEAAMLAQPITMLLPQVVGFRLTGRLAEGATATDLVLVIVEQLRRHGVVGKFVEFFGSGLAQLPLADRATIANMAPEYGATCGIFPIDAETIEYLRLTGRAPEQVALVEAYARAQGLWRSEDAAPARYTDVLELDLSSVEPSLAGPRRPQDRVLLRAVASTARTEIARIQSQRTPAAQKPATPAGDALTLQDGDVVIAAITSCTNTSNPSVMIAAGLLARKAHQRGLQVRPWVKTSLAPGSKVVTDYLQEAGLLTDLEALGFHVVGYGCTTCIGNSGPLPAEIRAALAREDRIVASVLSGNRNFEGRIHADTRMNYLASPPLVVAYALAGNLTVDLYQDPLGEDAQGTPVYLRDLWPSNAEIQAVLHASVTAQGFARTYASVYAGEERWRSLSAPAGDRFAWEEDSTYIRHPPYFQGMSLEPAPLLEIQGARVLAFLGDSVTTDHISPAGSIRVDSPAGRYLSSLGVAVADFNSYGARRGNHEVMTRGTFANIRLRNRLVPGTEGGYTAHLPDGEMLSIYDAAMRYQAEGTPLLIIAGQEYGTGSSRDWAAKGTLLLGVRAVLVESFERIHRSNLVGMGILPLQFLPGENAASLGLTGKETFSIDGLGAGLAQTVAVQATREDGSRLDFQARVRLDTPQEVDYYRHGGILPYVLRQLLKADA
jgi:aconitate hydratase